eukprot:21215_1
MVKALSGCPNTWDVEISLFGEDEYSNSEFFRGGATPRDRLRVVEVDFHGGYNTFLLSYLCLADPRNTKPFVLLSSKSGDTCELVSSSFDRKDISWHVLSSKQYFMTVIYDGSMGHADLVGLSHAFDIDVAHPTAHFQSYFQHGTRLLTEIDVKLVNTPYILQAEVSDSTGKSEVLLEHTNSNLGSDYKFVGRDGRPASVLRISTGLGDPIEGGDDDDAFINDILAIDSFRVEVGRDTMADVDVTVSFIPVCDESTPSTSLNSRRLYVLKHIAREINSFKIIHILPSQTRSVLSIRRKLLNHRSRAKSSGRPYFSVFKKSAADTQCHALFETVGHDRVEIFDFRNQNTHHVNLKPATDYFVAFVFAGFEDFEAVISVQETYLQRSVKDY